MSSRKKYYKKQLLIGAGIACLKSWTKPLISARFYSESSLPRFNSNYGVIGCKEWVGPTWMHILKNAHVNCVALADCRSICFGYANRRRLQNPRHSPEAIFKDYRKMLEIRISIIVINLERRIIGIALTMVDSVSGWQKNVMSKNQLPIR